VGRRGPGEKSRGDGKWKLRSCLKDSGSTRNQVWQRRGVILKVSEEEVKR
jgi:hypothetical protein